MKNALATIDYKIKKTLKTYSLEKNKVNLIAVSKKFGADKIKEAISLGCKIFGENYISEAKEKWPEIKQKTPNIQLHFIGHLQSNKAKEAVELFDVIQTLDRKKLASALKNEIAKQGKNPEIFIQVNIGDEEQKSGVKIDELEDLLNFAQKECNLNVSGLMCIPPEDELAAPYFALLAKLAKKHNLPNLSMGMSADFEEAIAMGANYIRIGTKIFGQRT